MPTIVFSEVAPKDLPLYRLKGITQRLHFNHSKPFPVRALKKILSDCSDDDVIFARTHTYAGSPDVTELAIHERILPRTFRLDLPKPHYEDIMKFFGLMPPESPREWIIALRAWLDGHYMYSHDSLLVDVSALLRAGSKFNVSVENGA